MTNEWLEVDCGPKFIRIGEPPANAPPGAGPAGVKWRSDGKSAIIACRGETKLTITPTP
jgi:DNA-binding beta-propeller fold protein YncE